MKVRASIERLTERAKHALAQAYGVDALGVAIVVVSLVCQIVATRAGAVWAYVGCALCCYELWRMVSPQRAARSHEDDVVMGVLMRPVHRVRRLASKWRNRKTKAYVRCPNCHEEFALPKGKGKLRATCPHCGEKSVHTV